MAQHEKWFAGSVLQGSCILVWIAAGQLCILRRSNLNHLHILQRSWSTALLAPALPQRFPISNHCHTSPISFGNCAGNLVCHRSEKPPWPLLAPLFLEQQKFKNFGQILKNASFGHAKFGQFCIFWGPNSSEFRGNSAAFCVDGGQARDVRNNCCVFFGTVEVVRVIRACERNTSKHCVLLCELCEVIGINSEHCKCRQTICRPLIGAETGAYLKMCALRSVLTARFGTSVLRSCEPRVKSRHTSSIQHQKRQQSKSPLQPKTLLVGWTLGWILS